MIKSFLRKRFALYYYKAKAIWGNRNKRRILTLMFSAAMLLLLYVGGFVGQLYKNQWIFHFEGGLFSSARINLPSLSIAVCLRTAFSWCGICGILTILLIGAGVDLFVYLNESWHSRNYDERGFLLSDKTTYGSSKFMSDEELHQILDLKKVEQTTGVILGVPNNNDGNFEEVISVPPDTQLNGHIFMAGDSGSRKTRAFFRPAIYTAILRGESIIAADYKTELYRDTYSLLKKYKYKKVWILNFNDPSHSDCWNPMYDIKHDLLAIQKACANIMANTTDGKGDKFFDNGEQNLLTALSIYVCMSKMISEDQRHFPFVYELITKCTVKQLDAMLKVEGSNTPWMTSWCVFMTSDQKEGFKSGLGTRLQVFQTPAIQDIFSHNEINIQEPCREKVAIFIVPPERSLRWLSALFFTTLCNRIREYADKQPNLACDVPINLMLDEFSNLGRIGSSPDGSDFEEFQSLCRAYRVKLLIGVQSFPQFSNRYTNGIDKAIIANCQIQLLMGCNEPDTAKHFADAAGTMTIKTQNTRINKKLFVPYQVHDQYSEGEGEGRRATLNIDEITSNPETFGPDDMLIKVTKQRILRAKKYDFTFHPMCALADRLGAANVKDYIPARCSSDGVAKQPLTPVKDREPFVINNYRTQSKLNLFQKFWQYILSDENSGTAAEHSDKDESGTNITGIDKTVVVEEDGTDIAEKAKNLQIFGSAGQDNSVIRKEIFSGMDSNEIIIWPKETELEEDEKIEFVPTPVSATFGDKMGEYNKQGFIGNKQVEEDQKGEAKGLLNNLH